MLVYSQAKPPIFHGDVRPCFRRSGPAVSSALDNVALSLGDVIDAATQDTGNPEPGGTWICSVDF
jgi:hypothetical protein